MGHKDNLAEGHGGLGAGSAQSLQDKLDHPYDRDGFDIPWMEESRLAQIDRGIAGEVDAWTPPPSGIDNAYERMLQVDDDALDKALTDQYLDNKQALLDIEETRQRETPAFWTTLNAVYDPKLQFRFKVTIEGLKFEDKPGMNAPDPFNDKPDISNGVAWYAKSVEKPGLSYHKMDEDRRMNASMAVLTSAIVEAPIYKPINMVLVDPTYPNVTRKIIRWIRRSGLNEDTARKIIAGAGLSNEESFLNTIGDVTIEQLAPNGKWLEKWILRGAFPADISFGKLDYSSNDLVEISMTWYYTSFTVEFAGSNNEKEGSAGQIGKEDGYEYFSDEAAAPLAVPQNPQTACDAAWKGANKEDFPGGKAGFIARGNCPGVSGDEKAATEAAGTGGPTGRGATSFPSGDIDAITFATPDEIPAAQEEADARLAGLRAAVEAADAEVEAAKKERGKIYLGAAPSYGYVVEG